MRAVVLLSNQLGLGGSERQLHLLLSHLDAARYARHVVVFNPSPHRVLDEPLREAGVTVWRLPRECRGVPRRLLYLTRLLRRLKADVAHSWNAHDNPYAGIAGRLAGVPLRLGSVRGSLASSGLLRLPAPYRLLALRSVDAQVVNSRAAAEELRRRGYGERRVAFLPNCVPPAPERPAALRLPDLQPHHRVVAAVGNLRAVKNHRLFLDAMARVLPRFPDVRAAVVGQALPTEPDLPRQLEARVAELGLSGKLFLAGFHEDVPALMGSLAVVCLSSTSEGTPNVLLEAMAAGRPVVATAVGGVPELVRHGEDGLLVPAGDATAFAEAVATLLADPERARAMGEAGRRRVTAEHGCAAAARRLADLYERWLEEPPG